MGRLKAMTPRIATLPPRLSSPPPGDRGAFDRERDGQTWRRWYKTARWQALRWSILVRDLFTCQMCGQLFGDTSKLVADHKRPHRGDERLFWDEGNLTTLCASCHSGAKQRAEMAARL